MFPTQIESTVNMKILQILKFSRVHSVRRLILKFSYHFLKYFKFEFRVV